jgi:hypothetical protein
LCALLSHASTALYDFFLGLLFDREDEGDILLRNVGLSLNYTAVTTQKPVPFSFNSEL